MAKNRDTTQPTSIIKSFEPECGPKTHYTFRHHPKVLAYTFTGLFLLGLMIVCMDLDSGFENHKRTNIRSYLLQQFYSNSTSKLCFPPSGNQENKRLVKWNTHQDMGLIVEHLNQDLGRSRQIIKFQCGEDYPRPAPKRQQQCRALAHFQHFQHDLSSTNRAIRDLKLSKQGSSQYIFQNHLQKLHQLPKLNVCFECYSTSSQSYQEMMPNIEQSLQESTPAFESQIKVAKPCHRLFQKWTKRESIRKAEGIERNGVERRDLEHGTDEFLRQMILGNL